MATGGDEQDIVSEESVDINCVICVRKDRVNPAYKYCQDCKINLCTMCSEYHNDFTEGHRLGETRNNGEEEGLWTEKCPKHKSQLLHTYCIDHVKLVCGICVLTEHMNCRKEDLDIAATGSNNDQRVQKIKEQLKSALQSVDQVIDQLDSQAEFLKGCEQLFLDDIEDYTKRLLSRIEDLKSTAERTVTTEHHKLASEIKEVRKTCVTFKRDINKLVDAVNTSPEHENRVGYMMKRGDILTRNVDAHCMDSNSLIKTQSFVFKLDWRLDVLSDFSSLVSETERYNACRAGYFNVKILYDANSCNIRGCCVLPDGSVLLVDSNNNTLKLFDPTVGKVTNHLSVNDDVKGIARTSQHEVAVCASHIQMFSFDKQVCYTRTLKKSSCCQLAYCNGELYGSSQTSVHAFDIRNGNWIRAISKNTVNLFTNISGIAINRAGDRIFVTDTGNGLVCMDRSGKQLFTRSPTELGVTTAHGVCTDETGHVFVCGYDSNNVVQVSEDGRVVGQILGEEDGVVKPRCLCYDVNTHKLYIAGETSQLKVFRLG